MQHHHKKIVLESGEKKLGSKTPSHCAAALLTLHHEGTVVHDYLCDFWIWHGRITSGSSLQEFVVCAEESFRQMRAIETASCIFVQIYFILIHC